MKIMIDVKNVSKEYTLFNSSKEQLLSLFSKEKYGKKFKALNNVNFSAYEGEVVGFIGTNGSGKSTLSNIISGVVPETSGTVNVNGDVAIIAVAAGLNNELTGRENIELKCLMLGFSMKEIHLLEPDIIEFSELGEFIDQPVKSYSSGMKSRLGFAISVNVDPDILIIDEALSVGDKAFAEKSLNKMKEFKAAGKTMIFVSHSLSQMKKFCDKVLWLEFGKVKQYGEANDILDNYNEFLNIWQKLPKELKEKYRLKSLESKKTLNINDFLVKNIDQKNVDVNCIRKYIIRYTSKIAQIKSGPSIIYKHIIDEQSGFSSNKYKNEIYYINRAIKYKGETYYELSYKKSLLDDRHIIGWINVIHVKSYDFIYINSEDFTVELSGENFVYDTPWGLKIKDRYIEQSKYKGIKVRVLETWLLNQNIWLKIVFNNKKMWVNQTYVKR